MQISSNFVVYYKLRGETVLDLNNGYYKTLNENFNTALKLIESEIGDAELIGMLENGNIPEKQAAALRLENIDSVREAKILVKNLTGQDGKVREAVSYKVKEFVENGKILPYLQSEPKFFATIFSDAVTDINGNVCRNLIDTLNTLKNVDEFCDKFCPLLLTKTENLTEEVEGIDFQEGKYKVNKQVFKLYWCLETVFTVIDKTDFERVKKILARTRLINEYTIREKTAKILTLNFDDKELTEYKNELKQDQNYYVRRF